MKIKKFLKPVETIRMTMQNGFKNAKENVTDGLAEQRERPIHTMAALSTDRADY